MRITKKMLRELIKEETNRARLLESPEGHTLNDYINGEYDDTWAVDSALWILQKVNDLANAIADELNDASGDPLEPGFRQAIMPTLMRALEARGVKL